MLAAERLGAGTGPLPFFLAEDKLLLLSWVVLLLEVIVLLLLPTNKGRLGGIRSLTASRPLASANEVICGVAPRPCKAAKNKKEFHNKISRDYDMKIKRVKLKITIK